VDKIPVGSGKRGPITQQIQAKFLDLVHGKAEDPHGWLTYVRAERASDRR
jgi:branched-chain amino acid aminotransferase